MNEFMNVVSRKQIVSTLIYNQIWNPFLFCFNVCSSIEIIKILINRIVLLRELSWVGQLNTHVSGVLKILITFESTHYHSNL